MKPQRTYWHLEPLKRKPSEYDVVTSNLLYYVERGFEVQTPLADWYQRHQRGSPLRCRDWERFRDPRETTYSKYTDLQRKRETFVDGLLGSIEVTGYDRRLSPACVRVVDRVLGPLRYPVHGLQMAASYVGSMAPSGRIVIASLLQAADEIRRVQRLAYRMRQLQETHEGFGAGSKAAWERDPAWQPLRKVVERLLVTFDWGEALVALNLAVRPAFDELFMVDFGRLAAAYGDEVLQKLLVSLNEDCVWHRDWTRALLSVVLADDPGNRIVIQEWLGKWRPEVAAAVEGFARTFDEVSELPAGPSFGNVRSRIETFLSAYWASLECEGGELPREKRT